MIDLIFDGWLTDVRSGQSSLTLAADAETVGGPNARARTHRVEVGEVAAEGVRLADGVTVGVGDVVATRLNQRARDRRGWVKKR